ncbi:hypothetical protein M758_7G128900 [Ceratodon purpureus]|nr:hypothetical protein M758_7G128900 [Ceratodon purpureus]KAG0611286.1 hypothetical protein M758_7G128900 [Ceratodon purpureus]
MLLHKALLTRASATLCPSFTYVTKFRASTQEPATRLAFRVPFQGDKVRFSQAYVTRKARTYAMAANAGIDLEVFGKAKSGSGSPSKERGDCPFSQRIYIELEEKKLPYTATYIEEGDNKPDWFMEKNPEGLVPVLRDGENWIQDSDKIAEHLDKKYPEISLATPREVKEVGINIFQAFTSYLKSKKADDQSKEELLKELAALNEHLKTKVHRLWLCSCLDEEKMKLKLPLAVWE